MQEEGVIKFDLVFTPGAPPAFDQLRALAAWRRILWLLKLIGQQRERYGGYGYGNLSCRIEPAGSSPDKSPFVISGSQTGYLADPDEYQYAIVRASDLAGNRVIATGPVRPSSESLTHAMLYELDDKIRYVFHVHSPELWQHALDLEIPVTRHDVPYGTPAMAEEVRRLFRESDAARQKLFAMGGHQDGMLAFGSNAEEAGTRLITALAGAFQLDPTSMDAGVEGAG
jgi:ribulose-5-phosphate 4-epimerase/fuculose-1-phosphate aldolase